MTTLYSYFRLSLKIEPPSSSPEHGSCLTGPQEDMEPMTPKARAKLSEKLSNCSPSIKTAGKTFFAPQHRKNKSLSNRYLADS